MIYLGIMYLRRMFFAVTYPKMLLIAGSSGTIRKNWRKQYWMGENTGNPWKFITLLLKFCEHSFFSRDGMLE